jgi:hypothetical protein
MVCAGVLLFVTAGCFSDSLRASFGGPAKPHLVVVAPVNVVASRLQDALADAGIVVISKQQGDDLRLAGMTKEKKVFCFHLRREKAEGKEKTQILLQWDREADEDLWRTIVLPLVQPMPT